MVSSVHLCHLSIFVLSFVYNVSFKDLYILKRKLRFPGHQISWVID